jgi:hypothetical protein
VSECIHRNSALQLIRVLRQSMGTVGDLGRSSLPRRIIAARRTPRRHPTKPSPDVIKPHAPNVAASREVQPGRRDLQWVLLAEEDHRRQANPATPSHQTRPRRDQTPCTQIRGKPRSPARQEHRRKAKLTRCCITKPGADFVKPRAYMVAASREVPPGRKDQLD